MRVEVEPGVELNIRHHEGEGQPFVLVHGLSSNAMLWDGVAANLSGHPSYAIDLRSHGESDAPATGYDTTTAAADVAAVIDALGLQHPIVAGQSWGGNVVARLAAKQPELVGALALVDGGWIDLPSVFDSWQACEKALCPPAMDGVRADQLRAWVGKGHPDWSPEAIEATLANFRIRPDGTLERRLSIEHHLRILRSMWDSPPWGDLPLIPAPALLLPAAGPSEPKAELISKAAGLMGRATISWYPKSDHDLHAQHPERLAADLLTLVASR